MKKEIHKKIIRYTDEALGNYEIIEDFLPKPWEHPHVEKKVKITSMLKD